jgi:hypothetical protein
MAAGTSASIRASAPCSDSSSISLCSRSSVVISPWCPRQRSRCPDSFAEVGVCPALGLACSHDQIARPSHPRMRRLRRRPPCGCHRRVHRPKGRDLGLRPLGSDAHRRRRPLRPAAESSAARLSPARERALALNWLIRMPLKGLRSQTSSVIAPRIWLCAGQSAALAGTGRNAPDGSRTRDLRLERPTLFGPPKGPVDH